MSERLQQAIAAEIADEEARHERAMSQLQELKTKIEELAGDVADEEQPPAPATEPKPPRVRSALPRDPRAATGLAEERVLATLADGPLTQTEIREKAGIPKGSIGGLIQRLERAGKVCRQGTGRGSPWALAKATRGDSGSGGSNGGGSTPPGVLTDRVLEVLRHKRLGVAGVAAELEEPMEQVSASVFDLLERGKLKEDGQVFEAAA